MLVVGTRWLELYGAGDDRIKWEAQCNARSTYRYLLAQEIEVFFAVAQALLRGAEFVG